METRWRGSPLAAEIDDAVQEVFVECYRAEGPLQRVDPERDDFRGYLMGITRNIACRFEARASKRPKNVAGHTVLDGIAGRELGAEARFDQEWAKALIRDAVVQMETRAAAAGSGARMRVDLLRLRFGEGQPIREIAKVWEVDPDSLHRAYAKAREEFRGCLRQVVAFHAVRTEAELDDECRRLLALLKA